MILIGYHSTSGYNFYDASNKRTVISSDVIFVEFKIQQELVTGCQKVVTSYINVKTVPKDLEVIKLGSFEAQIEENVRISIRKRSLPLTLQDCELFQDNKVNDDGDFIHFTLTAKSEPVKMEEALSDPKWICATKEELESIEKKNTWELVNLPKGKCQLV